MAESLAEIAKKLNVAPSTISRAISSPDKVAPKTREKILAYINEIGYRPNISARNLRKQSSNTIGIIVNDLCDSLIARAANVMQDEASKRGYFPVLLSTEDSRTKEKECINSLLMSNACGLVIIPSSATISILDKLKGIPVVELDRSTGSNQNDEFRMDDIAAMQMATKYLINEGCAHIAVIFGNIKRVSSFNTRYLALKQCTNEAQYSSFFLKSVKAPGLTQGAYALTNAIIQNHIKQQSLNKLTLDQLVKPNTLDNAQGQTALTSSEASFYSTQGTKNTQGNLKAQEVQANKIKLTSRKVIEELNNIMLEESKLEFSASKNKTSYEISVQSNTTQAIDGVIAANHSIASGIIQACYAQKIKPNEELKIFTFDNPDWRSVLPFKIPSISHPLDKAAYLAINRLIDRIEHKYNEIPEARLLRPITLN